MPAAFPMRPHTGRDRAGEAQQSPEPISTHAPLVGRDETVLFRMFDVPEFKSTYPVRGTIADGKRLFGFVLISTHMSLMGHDEQG